MFKVNSARSRAHLGYAALALASVATLTAGPVFGQSGAQQNSVVASSSHVDDIVVTAQRSGIPVWRVRGPQTTLVLVGVINGVAKGTSWDPGSLNAALLKADRVMFPDSIAVTASVWSVFGYLAKWRKQATLPQGQELGTILRADQYARLLRLQQRGILKPGWERRHPLHLALALRAMAKGKDGYDPSINHMISRTVKKHRIPVVPVTRSKAKPLANDLFTSAPGSHVPCLMDSVALIEAGTGAGKARSEAWAQRRVPDVINSPADKVFRSCWPAGSAADFTADNLRYAIMGLMSDPKSTVAILSLESLARPGGVLDALSAAGLDVQGPRWRS